MPAGIENRRAIALSLAACDSAYRRLALPLFMFGLFSYGTAYAWYMLANFDFLNIVRDVNNDDAFYYFEIAKNLSDGRFLTFDSGITQTNGYHPFWLLLITPFYWAFDLDAALFGIKAFRDYAHRRAAILVVLAVSTFRLPLLPLIAVLPLFYRIHGLYLGLESAFALFDRISLLRHLLTTGNNVAISIDIDVEEIPSNFRCYRSVVQILRSDVTFLKAENEIQQFVLHLVKNP